MRGRKSWAPSCSARAAVSQVSSGPTAIMGSSGHRSYSDRTAAGPLGSRLERSNRTASKLSACSDANAVSSEAAADGAKPVAPASFSAARISAATGASLATTRTRSGLGSGAELPTDGRCRTQAAAGGIGGHRTPGTGGLGALGGWVKLWLARAGSQACGRPPERPACAYGVPLLSEADVVPDELFPVDEVSAVLPLWLRWWPLVSASDAPAL